LKRNELEPIWQKIEQNWQESGAWPEYVEAMRQALPWNKPDSAEIEGASIKWALLPGICCQAAGGDPRWADELAAAWLLFYIAAHIMDNVEDQDAPDAWWAGIGPGVAINIASGLYFSASQLLAKVYTHKETRGVAVEITRCFHDSFLTMCSGQQRDLVLSEPTLEHYWKNAEAKSGAFFALACRAGARLATNDNKHLDGYYHYGLHIGFLIQVLDDLEDFRAPYRADASRRYASLRRSLPVVYALQVYPQPVGNQLNEYLHAADADSQAFDQAYQLIEKSGAVIYLLTEIERHKVQAMAALEQADPQPPAAEIMRAFLAGLGDHS
jgi:geranylgeranyl pyrophosphate synthase